jgi:hypothetical protein
MKMQQMKEHLSASQEQMMGKTETNQEERLARMDASQERSNENPTEEIKSGQAEIKSIVNAFQEMMDARIANIRDNLKETMYCQLTTEACLDSKEPNSEDTESEVEHHKVPTEEAAVKSLGTMKKQHSG